MRRQRNLCQKHSEDREAISRNKPRSLLECKLAKYGIAGGALLAAAAAANADSIVFSGPVNQSVSNGGALSFALDGTTTAFELTTNAYSYNAGNGNYDYYGSTGLDTYTGGGIDSSIPLAAGAAIGPGSSFTSYTQLDYLGEYGYSSTYSSPCGYKNENTCYYTDYYGPFYSSNLVLPNNNNPYYIGLEFTRGGQTYYGWAQIGSEAAYGSAYAELYDYAYNDTPDASIMAGEESTPIVTPEPPTAALLALGAVGFLILKRRRKALRLAV